MIGKNFFKLPGAGRIVFFLTAAFFIAEFFSIDSVLAKVLNDTASHTVNNSMGNNKFNWWLDIDDDAIVVGATEMGNLSNVWGHRNGAAYFFRRNGNSWIEEDRVIPCDSSIKDNFGARTKISGNKAAVSALGTGAIYIFERGGVSLCAKKPNNNRLWSEVAKLTPNGPADHPGFFSSFDIDGDTVVAGDYVDDSIDTDSGAVYIFRKSGDSWIEEAKLTAGDAAAGEMLGRSVAISGNIIVVGSAYHDINGVVNAGAAYVFRRNGNTWIEEAKLISNKPTYYEFFGEAVDISGDTIVIGAKGNDDLSYNSGAIYVFRYNDNTWRKETRLIASDINDAQYFGRNVSISGDTIAAKSLHNKNIFVFQRSGNVWIEKEKNTTQKYYVCRFVAC